MKLLHGSAFAVVAASCIGQVAASIFSRSESLEARASWGDANPLSLVFNGQPNVLTVSLLNHGKSDISIDSISGAFRETAGKERHLANTTASKYSLVLPPNSVVPVDVPYRFYSELRPQDVGFVVYVDYSDTADLKKEKHRTIAYDGSATIREPPSSWFDLQLLLLYPLVLALFGLPLYLLYTSVIAPRLFPAPKAKKSATAGKTTRSEATAVVAKSPTPRPSTPSDPSEWIPSHHLKTRRTVSGRNLVAKGTGGITPSGGVTSGDETSGNESGTPRRSARATKGKSKAL